MHDTKDLSKIDHFLITVSNLETSIAWYTSSFNCNLIYKHRTLAILEFNNVNIVLSLPSDQRPHLAVQKDNAEEFGEIMEQSDLCHSTFIADPSGNPIELIKKSFEKVCR